MSDAAGSVTSGDPDGVLYHKHLMVLEGDPGYEHHLIASDDGLSATRRESVPVERERFMSWGNGWEAGHPCP